MMDYLKYITDEIHTVVAATTDNDGLPVTCAIDIMDFDENGLYFLTAKGKGFYKRLTEKNFIAFTGIKGRDTMSSTAISVRGKVREVGTKKLKDLFCKNPYMSEIYKTEESRSALTVFCIYEGAGEWFDLSKKPIERESFAFGRKREEEKGYFINESCIGCESCLAVCPQSCIMKGRPFLIEQAHCLHCGNCFSVCRAKAVEKRN
ncbi:MAG: 4Fe-4S dicluster domain-containing protein [Acutalibacteraceae bacterium]